jgi:hypothetical protein
MRGIRFDGARLEARLWRHPRAAVGALVASGAGLLASLLVVVLALAPASASAESLCTNTWVGPSEGTWRPWRTGPPAKRRLQPTWRA